MIFIAGPGHGGPGVVANTYLEGSYSEFYPEHHAGRGWDAAAVQSVLVSRRNSRATHRRRRRARSIEGGELGYSLLACLWRGIRQSGPGGLLRRRRRRSRNRPARHELALEQVSESRARRRGAADSAPERLQDRESHCARADSARRADSLLRGYGYKPYFVEGDDPAHDARADGRDDGCGHEEIRGIQRRRARTASRERPRGR